MFFQIPLLTSNNLNNPIFFYQSDKSEMVLDYSIIQGVKILGLFEDNVKWIFILH